MRLLNKLNTTNFFLCSFPSDSIKPVFFFAGDAPGWVKLLLTISNSIFVLFLCYQSWSVSREESQYYRYISPWPVRDLFVTLSDSPLLYLVKRYSTCGAAFLFGQECKRIYMESRGLKLGVLGQLERNLSSSSPVHFSTFVWSLYLSLTLCLLTPILLVSTFAITLVGAVLLTSLITWEVFGLCSHHSVLLWNRTYFTRSSAFEK